MERDVISRPIRDIVRNDVPTVRPHDTVRETLQILLDQNLPAVAVVNHEGRFLGVVSQCDLVGMTRELVEDLSDLTRIQEVLMKWLDQNVKEVGSDRRKVAAIMSQDVPTVRPNCLIIEAARVLLNSRSGCLPVVNETGNLEGVVFLQDLLSIFLEEVSE